MSHNLVSRALTLGALSYVLVLAACKPPFEIDRNSAYVVGPTNDIVSLDKNERRRVPERSVAGAVMIATKLNSKRVKFCSGTLIAGEDGGTKLRILTNHHCFATTDAEDKATPEVFVEACTNTTAYFGFLPGEATSATPIGCGAGSLRTNFLGDLAVFTLTKNPPEKYKPVELWDGDDAPEGRAAFIVHFPDVEEDMAVPPEGGVKLPTAALTINDCKSLGAFPIGEWDLDRTLPFSLRHTCDLIHGSSGSGFVDAETGKLLGVNWGGIKISGDGGTRIDNVATKASFVQAFLNDKVDEAVQLAQGSKQSYDAAVAQKHEALKGKSTDLAKTVRKSCGVVGAEGFGGSLVALMLALLPLVAPRALASATSAPSAVKVPELQAHAVSWSTAYLTSTAFRAERDAVLTSFASDGERQNYFATADGKALDAKVASATEGLASAAKPDCAVEAELVRDFAAHQRALAARGQLASAELVVEPLAKHAPSALACLVLQLAVASNEQRAEGYDPLPLLVALAQKGHPLTQDPSMHRIQAARYVELGQYAEALRLIVALAAVDPAQRHIYDSVQRTFSSKQKGDGSVALRGI